MQLPDIDGFEVAARLIAGNGASPAIVLTSSRDVEDLGPLAADEALRGFVPKSELSGAALGGAPLTGLRRALWGLAGAGVVAGGLTAAVIGSSDFIGSRDLVAVLTLLVGWGFIGVGLVAWGYRPENRLGTLMTATGFAFFLSMAGLSDLPLLFLIGNVLGSLFMATAVHLLLAAPTGRLQSTWDRRLVAIAYLMVTVMVLPAYFFADPRDDWGCERVPREPDPRSATTTRRWR